MKTMYQFKKWGLILIAMAILSPLANAQARYKHVPRIRVDKKEVVETPEKKVSVKATEVSIPTDIPPVAVQEEQIQQEKTLVASSDERSTITYHKKAGSIHQDAVKSEYKPNKEAFTERVKSKSSLMHVKEVKKTNIIGYLLWFLIVLLLGIALFTLAFIFLSIIAYSLYYVFLVFGIVGLSIALIILIFGLAGII